MTNLIVAKQLSKQFQKYKAIENLNFTVEEGEILGFLGPSGSGKTTTINILTGQLTPSQGETYILGKSSLQLKEKDLSKIGLITENSGFYEKLTLHDNLLFFAKLYNVSLDYIDDLMKRVGLYDHRKTLADKLSTGMKPVSYTHLDVYKRQDIDCHGVLALFNLDVVVLTIVDCFIQMSFSDGFTTKTEETYSICLLYTSRCV